MDIVERLREEAADIDGSRYGQMMTEAATEIERLRQRDGFINNLDKQIIEKDKEIDKLLDALWDIHSMCNNWPLVSAYRIKKHIRLTLGGS